MKTLILYKTKWGSTKQYAEYLHSKIENSDIFSIDTFSPTLFENYQNIIIGSRIYMGNIQALKFVKKIGKKLVIKKLFFLLWV